MKTLNLILFGWFIIGSLVLLYYQNIDGVYVNKPISFSVDTQALQVNKPSYRAGDTIDVLFSYCRTRDFTTLSTWKLINEFVVTYPETRTVQKPECVTNRWVAIGVVPPDAIAGTHHLEGTTEIQLNALHSVYVDYRSVNFQVSAAQR